MRGWYSWGWKPTKCPIFIFLISQIHMVGGRKVGHGVSVIRWKAGLLFWTAQVLSGLSLAPPLGHYHCVHRYHVMCHLLVWKGFVVASFPGSPCARTKNRKERGEPGKIYHVRNVIGRENLITCGQTNELTHALLTEYTCSVTKALWLTVRD